MNDMNKNEEKNMTMKLKVMRIGEHTLPLPEYKTPKSSGLDLHCANKSPVIVPPKARYVIPTGFAYEIPVGYEGHIRPRSSMSARGVDAAFGTIDSDYRGEVSAIITNNTGSDLMLQFGDRIAQLVIVPVAHCHLVEVEELSRTERGHGGFGSTGNR